MSCHRSLAVALALVLLLAPIPTTAQTAPGAARQTIVVGTAWSTDAEPLPNARVRWRNAATGEVEATATTNQRGEFKFQLAGGGTFEAELVDSRGNVTTAAQTITVTAGATIVVVFRFAGVPPPIVSLSPSPSTAQAAGATGQPAEDPGPSRRGGGSGQPAVSAGSQGPTGQIMGTAKDEAKKPYADYSVRTREIAGGLIAGTTPLDTTGAFVVPNLPTARYLVELLNKDGKVVCTEGPFNVADQQVRDGVVIDCDKIPAAWWIVGAAGVAGITAGVVAAGPASPSR